LNRFDVSESSPEQRHIHVLVCLQVACDLTPYAGQTLYLWNTKDENRMKDVPFFCNSHLVMRIDVLAQCSVRGRGRGRLSMANGDV
jgi:hypothetical protein